MASDPHSTTSVNPAQAVVCRHGASQYQQGIITRSLNLRSFNPIVIERRASWRTVQGISCQPAAIAVASQPLPLSCTLNLREQQKVRGAVASRLVEMGECVSAVVKRVKVSNA